MMPESLPDQTRGALKLLRVHALRAETAALTGAAPESLEEIAHMRLEAVNVSSVHGTFRQLFDKALGDVEAWARLGDLHAAATSLSDVQALLASLEEECRHV